METDHSDGQEEYAYHPYDSWIDNPWSWIMIIAIAIIILPINLLLFSRKK